MKLISNDLRDGDKLPHRHVFNGMGYDGDNISPHLAWDDVPAGTKSFVVTCYDPDGQLALAGGTGWLLTYPPIPVYCRKDLALDWWQSRTAFCKHVPILVKRDTTAQHHRKAKLTATFLPFTRWM